MADTPRTATVRAVTPSDLYVLDKAMFDRTLAVYPDIAARLRARAAERRESDQDKHSVEPASGDPSRPPEGLWRQRLPVPRPLPEGRAPLATAPEAPSAPYRTTSRRCVVVSPSARRRTT